MALLIKYTSECECGGKFTMNTLDLTQEPGERVVIDLDMLGGVTMECDSCDDRVFLPELSDLIEDVES
jgi:hypothetical protein